MHKHGNFQTFSSFQYYNIISFNPEKDIMYKGSAKKHKYSNTMIFKAFDAKNKLLIENTFYSIGGGFIIDESSTLNKTSKIDYEIPFDFNAGDFYPQFNELILNGSRVRGVGFDLHTKIFQINLIKG